MENKIKTYRTVCGYMTTNTPMCNENCIKPLGVAVCIVNDDNPDLSKRANWDCSYAANELMIVSSDIKEQVVLMQIVDGNKMVGLLGYDGETKTFAFFNGETTTTCERDYFKLIDWLAENVAMPCEFDEEKQQYHLEYSGLFYNGNFFNK